MGLFEDLGRKVGKFTHEAKQAADEGAPYVCRNCGERFYTEQDPCPECGAEAVVKRDETVDGSNSEATDSGRGTSDDSSDREPVNCVDQSQDSEKAESRTDEDEDALE
ncbi:zinc ribbon domain-containing protein [Natrarchaeobius sp. A-rgal3]|uniref:zinc ribbon domain-containing protein n=1 Tax=Natrarchaeobius versutus TaxID=1679078 RepID=UPI00351039EB